MSVFLVGESALSSFLKLVLLLVIFILILAASYYVTKWYAKSGLIKNKTSNIEIVESFPMGQSRQVCILRVGEKYLCVSVCKEQIRFLAEIPKEQLSMEQPPKEPPSGEQPFQDVFMDMLKQKLPGGTHKKEKGTKHESMEK